MLTPRCSKCNVYKERLTLHSSKRRPHFTKFLAMDLEEI
jgi:hypothetical protein